MNSWLRLYHEVVDDPKVQQLDAHLFKLWVNQLCIAGKYGGVHPPVKEMAFILRMTEEQLKAGMDLLVSAGLIETDGTKTYPHNYQRRQFKSDSSTPRVKRYREHAQKRFRNVSRNKDSTVTETDQIQNRTDNPKVPFAHFWQRYPKRKGKQRAQEEWDRLNPDAKLADEIFQAIEAQKQTREWLKNRGEFIPLPATWLHQRRWEDETTVQLDADRPRSVVL